MQRLIRMLLRSKDKNKKKLPPSGIEKGNLSEASKPIQITNGQVKLRGVTNYLSDKKASDKEYRPMYGEIINWEMEESILRDQGYKEDDMGNLVVPLQNKSIKGLDEFDNYINQRIRGVYIGEKSGILHQGGLVILGSQKYTKEDIKRIEDYTTKLRANLILWEQKTGRLRVEGYDIFTQLPTKMYLSMKTNREMARIVMGEKRAKDMNKEFKNDIIDIPFGDLKQVQQAMENLFNKVVMQRGLSQEELDMVRVLSEGMTTTEFETFYQEYKPIVEEMFYSSDSRVMYSGKYLKDGKIHYIENGVVSGGEKREIARDFIDSLRRFRGLTQEELDATVSVKGYRYDKNGNRL